MTSLLHLRNPRIIIICLITAASLISGCKGGDSTPTVLPSPSETARIETATLLPSSTDTIQPSHTPAPVEPTQPQATQTTWITVVVPPAVGDQTQTLNSGEQGPAEITPTPTRTRIPTRTPPVPFASLRIEKPGPYSKVLSPIPLRAVISPGDDKQVYIDLIGEDGRVITSERMDYSASIDRIIYTNAEIPFKITALAETARLVLYTLDRFNRVIYQTSVDLILIQIGDNRINVPLIEQEPYVIRKPWEGATVRGGVMEIEGQARLINDQPLVFEIIDESGNLVGSGEVQVDQPSEDQPFVPFSVLIPYSVTRWTPARLSAHQNSANRIPGTVWLTSVSIYLEP